MIDTIYSVRVWLRRTPRSRWILWGAFATREAAAQTITEKKRRGRLVGETLTRLGMTDPNEDGKR